MTHAYEKLASDLVSKATRSGADAAEVFLEVGRSGDVRVRDGEIEDLTQAASKGLGLRVFVKGRMGFAWTSDFAPNSLKAFVARAIAIARASAAHASNGLPSRKEQGNWPVVNDMYDPKVAALSPDWKVDVALEVEKHVRSNPRIKAIESVGAGESVSEVFLASSTGVRGSYRGSTAYLYAAPVASDGKQLQTSSWYDAKRFLDDLESPEQVAEEAVRRAVRLLGAKQVKSVRVPVVFEPAVAASFVAAVANACNGDAVFKNSSFLAGRLGEKVAPAGVAIIDDGLLPKGMRTAPFDGEGVASRRTALVERGCLSAFLYDAFTARKAKKAPTGSASRGYRSLPAIGHTNLYLAAGDCDPKAIIAGVRKGFYVTSMLGHGVNQVTGDFSQGANGLWIENGELTHAVHEVTVAGNLLSLLASIDAVGNDLDFRSSTAAPTIRVRELTVAGG